MKNINRPNTNRVVFISDIHLGVRNASFEWIDNTVNYFDNFFVPLLQSYVDAGDVVNVIIAGDFFDNRQNIDINIMNVGADIMQKISSVAETFVSIGNHDIYKKKDTNITSLRIFKSFKNVKLIEELTTFTVADNVSFLIVPWVGDPKEETDILLKHSSDVNYVVLHSDIAGLNYDNGRQIINGVNITSVAKKIYSGHIHKRQETDKVTYIGSPYQLRRSDIGNTKGIYSLKIVSSDNITEEFKENTYSPKFLRVPIENVIDSPLSYIKSIFCNNYVDIIIKRKYMNDINISKFMQVMDYCKPKKIEILLDKLDTSDIEDSEETSKDMTIEDVFKMKISKMDLSDKEKETLLKLNSYYTTQALDILGDVADDSK